VLLGLWFDVFGTLWNVALAVATAITAARARRSAVLVRFVNRALGALFIWLGLRVAMATGR
jgi:threonine/homoserine/homoserine lactone efflux protein